MRAADFVGPNARNFSAVKRSTIPAARGSSGPITVRSMRFSRANRTSAFKSPAEMGTFSAISAVPAFPGAQKIRSASGDRPNFHASACSRPPPPITRIFIANWFDCRGWSVVEACADDDASAERALARLCQDYWPPLYTFARRRGNSSPDAQDLVQGFFAYLLQS